jgi:hypothetical protein
MSQASLVYGGEIWDMDELRRGLGEILMNVFGAIGDSRRRRTLDAGVRTRDCTAD